MASFTEQLVAFNPYVPQMPTDDYVRVGMIKQQQYNEGVQKVQSYIDSVAGLDVIKPEQKEYLQQRVGQLSGEVGKIVSQDFSNQQMVNSVGSLTGKIAGDPIVQNAVYSTQRYKQGLADMREAQEKGLNSPSNEYVFQKKVQDWMGDGDVKSSFTGEYEKYTDTKKPILEAINALKPSANITDIPYETDSQGNYVLDKNGGRKIAYATLREKLEGVSEGRIKQAIEASISPQMKRQFQIDGMYQYKDLDKYGLKKMADSSYGYRLGQVNDIIQGLTTQLGANQNNDQRKRAIQAQIDQYRLSGKDLQNQYKQDVEFMDKNPDAYKGELHYQDEVAKYTLGYSWSKHSLTYENNPIFNGVMKEKTLDLNWSKFVETSQYHKDLLNLKREEVEMRMQMMRLKLGKGQGDGLFHLDAPVLSPIAQDELEKVNISTIQDQISTMSDDLDSQKMKAISQMDGGANWLENRDGKVIYKDQASKDAAETALKTLKAAYDKDPSKVSPAMQTYFSGSSNQEAVVQNYKTTADKIMTEADKRFGTEHLTKGVSPLAIVAPDGQHYAFTPKELLDLAEKQHKQEVKYPMRAVTTDPLSGGSYIQPRSKAEEEAYIAPFNRKERALVDAVNSGKAQKGVLEGYGKALDKLYSPEARAMLSKRDDYIQTESRRAYTQNQAASFPVIAYKAADATRAKAAFVNIINDQEAADKENANPNFNAKGIGKMLDEKNARGTTYSLHAKPDGNFSVRFSNTTISRDPYEMDITPEQAGKWFGSFVNEFKPIQTAINLSKYNGVGATTDVRGGGKETAYMITPTEQLKNYSVKYHVEEAKPGEYQVKLFIYDKKGKTWLPDRYADFGGRLLNQQQVLAAVNHLTDSEIDRIKGKNTGAPVLPPTTGDYTGPDPFVDKQGVDLGDREAEEPDTSTDDEEE